MRTVYWFLVLVVAMRVGPITPTVLVVLPSTAVHAIRLNRRRSGEVCSVPITTVSPGPSMYALSR